MRRPSAGPLSPPHRRLALSQSISVYHVDVDLDDDQLVIPDGRDDGNNRHGQEVKLAIELGLPGSCNT